MNHAELVALGAQWLFRKKYPLVVTELVTYAGEVPDVLAMGNYNSYLIECKTSRQDFKNDQFKPWRTDEKSIGNYRSYLCPEGLIKESEVPFGWGLLHERNGKVKKIIEAPFRKKGGYSKEYLILMSLIRRIGANAPAGVSVSCYKYETKNNATMGVRE